ncbi:serine protease [Sorangium sp. So ce134]
MRPTLTFMFSFLTMTTLAGCVGSEADYVPEDVASDALPIVGGVPAVAAEWPWMVSLRDSTNSHFCGGTLIAPTWVLTAAHCGAPASVKIGPAASTAVSRGVAQRIAHPSYNASTSANDIALLRLSSAVTGVATAPLNRDAEFPNGVALSNATGSASRNVRVAGWGDTSEGGSPSATLLAAAVPVITNSSCATAYSGLGAVFASNICAGLMGGGVDTCQGDSGGPLTFQFGGPLLSGITSWGEGCARPGLPGIYARISSYIDWIAQHVSNSQTVSPTALIAAAALGG